MLLLLPRWNLCVIGVASFGSPSLPTSRACKLGKPNTLRFSLLVPQALAYYGVLDIPDSSLSCSSILGIHLVLVVGWRGHST